MGTMLDPTGIAGRYNQVRERIAVAARRVGRDPETVTLVAVAKTFDVAAVRAAVAAGAHDIGESYVQEAAPKIESLAAEMIGSSERPPRWHFIGHLQRNKASRAVRLFDLIQSVDNLRLAEHLDRVAAECDKSLSVLIEVNVGKERTKGGITEASALHFLTALASLKRLRVEGMMTVPPPVPHPEASRSHFRALAGLRADLASQGFDLPHLSMGMTDDYEVAVEEGATIVRVGRAIFGPRARRVT
jgi:pyridoxal phosphate enzyme (YggS family)